MRADVRPALPHEDASESIVGRVRARLATFPPSELLLILPVLA